MDPKEGYRSTFPKEITQEYLKLKTRDFLSIYFVFHFEILISISGLLTKFTEIELKIQKFDDFYLVPIPKLNRFYMPIFIT